MDGGKQAGRGQGPTTLCHIILFEVSGWVRAGSNSLAVQTNFYSDNHDSASAVLTVRLFFFLRESPGGTNSPHLNQLSIDAGNR